MDWAPGEVRVAMLRAGQPWDLFISRSSRPSIVGNIYLGRIVGMDRGLQAAFVDIGEHSPAILKLPRKAVPGAPPLHKGAAVLVQATRDGFEDKGPAVSSRVALAGRYTVLTPGRPGLAASRRIADLTLRQRLQGLAKSAIRAGEGLVLRTAAAMSTDEALLSEIERLRAQWETTEQAAAKAHPPALLHHELPPLFAFLRDVLPSQPVPVRTDDRQTLTALRSYFEEAAPEHSGSLDMHGGPEPLFEEHGIETEIEAALQRDWLLPSGGSIAVERTRALTTVDVDTGSSGGRRHGGSDRDAVNLAAAREAARLIRFRNNSGLVVIDFAGAGWTDSARTLSGAIRSGFAEDRAAVAFGELSKFGLFEMSRERLGPSLPELLASPMADRHEPSAETRLLSALRRLVRSRPTPPECAIRASEAEAGLLRGPLAAAVREAERRLGYPVAVISKGPSSAAGPGPA